MEKVLVLGAAAKLVAGMPRPFKANSSMGFGGGATQSAALVASFCFNQEGRVWRFRVCVLDASRRLGILN